jgi:Cu/Ag efflux protein CusF
MKTKRLQILTATAMLFLVAALAFAHNGVEHVMGTVAAIADTSITVTTVKHTPVTVLLEPATIYTFNDAKASLKDLKVGERVVINAKENAEHKLVGVSVRWGANSSAHTDHKQ